MNMKLRLSVPMVLGLCLCLVVLVARTEAQLNFSTGWGKRSQLPPQLAYQDDGDVAVEPQDRHSASRLQQSDLDLFLRYYRRLKQIEAQRLASSAI